MPFLDYKEGFKMKKYMMMVIIASLVFTGGCSAKKEIVDVDGTEVTVIEDNIKSEEIAFEGVEKIEDMNVIAWISEDEAIVTVPTDIDTFEYDMGKDPIWKTMKFNYATGDKEPFGPEDLYVYPLYFIKPSLDSNYLFVDGFKLNEKSKESTRVFLVLDRDGNEISQVKMMSDGGYNWDFHWTEGNLLGYIHDYTTLEYIDPLNPDTPVFSKMLVKGRDQYSSDEEFYQNDLRSGLLIGDKVIYGTFSAGSYIYDVKSDEKVEISDKMIANIYKIDDATVVLRKPLDDDANGEALVLLDLNTKEEKVVQSGGMPVVLGISSDGRYIAFESYGDNVDSGVKIYDTNTEYITELPTGNCLLAMNKDLSIVSGSMMDDESPTFKYFTVIFRKNK